MAEAVDGGDEVILRLCCCDAAHERIEHSIIGISEEDRLEVRVVDADMLHAVLFLIAARQLVLLDDAVHVVLYSRSHNKTELRLAVHRLRIDVVHLLAVLLEPALVLELLEVLSSLLIDARVVLACADGEVNLGLDDVIKRLLIVASLSTSLLRVKNIVWAALYLLNEIFWWTNATKRFYNSHNLLLVYLSTCLLVNSFTC